jgi:hypothetical protein
VDDRRLGTDEAGAVTWRTWPSLASDFDSSSEHPRMVAVVSPTCPDCAAGVRLIADALEERPAATVQVFIVWTAMRQGDSVETAHAAGAALDRDPRTWQCWEPEGWVLSSALRPLLGLGPFDPRRSAWDVYLWYGPGAVSNGRGLPKPREWAYNTVKPLPGAVGRLTPTRLGTWLVSGGKDDAGQA